MKKRKYTIQKDVTLLSFSLFVIVTLWIGLTVYGIYVTSTVSDTLQLQISPIKGSFDKESISIIENRIPVIPEYSASDSASTVTFDALPTPFISNEQLLPTQTPNTILQPTSESAGGQL